MIQKNLDWKKTKVSSSTENKIIQKKVRENNLDFLFNLYKGGLELLQTDIQLLKDAGLINRDHVDAPVKEIPMESVSAVIPSIVTLESAEADSKIDITTSFGLPDTVYDVLTVEQLTDRKKKHGHIFEGRVAPILDYEWKPVSTTEHESDFVNWINSINKKGFENRIQYHKFSLYVQQAYMWLAENKTPADFDDDDDRLDFCLNEFDRCARNVLYFLNKYKYYGEGNAADKSGKIKYVATAPHEVLCYLDDCGYSVGFVKGRQQAATTTLMGINMRDVLFKTNHFMKFITEDEKKAVEIFTDKLKVPFSFLPDWMRPIPLNDRDNLFAIGKKTEKGKREGAGSRILVDAPKRTAIAGGAPQKVCIDEAGNIDILGEMTGNARPTQWFFNPETGKMELRRKLWFWGTGGEMEKGGKSLETEFMAILNAWDEGKFDSGIVPLFFNWRCRPGATEEIYQQEKRVAYAKAANPSDPKGKKHITEFHQSWPETLSDVFRTSAKILVDEDWARDNLKRIRDAKSKYNFELHYSGFFEPVYDFTQPMPESCIVPYKVIGAEFVRTEDIDPRVTTVIFHHPDDGYKNRYFKGTDPIDTNSGLSKFSSTVWDKWWNCPVAILNYRIPDYHQVFLQSLLLNLYYDTKDVKEGIHELVESNRGSSYCDFIEALGWDNFLVLNYQLPRSLINNSTINNGRGVDKKGQRSSIITNKLTELLQLFGGNIFFEVVFEQLLTFTCKITDAGKETWGPINIKYYNDDVLDSLTYSYICAELCFPELEPTNLKKLASQVRIAHKLVRDPLTKKLSMKAVKENMVTQK